MPDISLVRKHALTTAKARALVQQVADDLAAEYNLASEWVGDTLRFQRSGVQGTMRVLASEIQLEVTLGFLLKPFRGKFLEHIEGHFDRLLGAAKAQAKTATRKSAAKPAKKAARKTGRAS